MIHQRELIVGVGIPGPINLKGPRGLPRRSVAQVEGDATILVGKLLHGVEGRIWARDALDTRIQSAACDQEQREARARFFVMDANGALFDKAHSGPLLPDRSYAFTGS